MPEPQPLSVIEYDLKELKKLLREHDFPSKLIANIETRALRSGRRQTGVFKTNRQSRWSLIHDDPEHGTDPQYGSEQDCKAILIILLLTTLEFRNAPVIDSSLPHDLSQRYLGRELEREKFRDSLLLEYLDYRDLCTEAANPTH